MGLGILLSLLLVFEFGASSPPRRVNPQSNPFTADLRNLIGEGDVVVGHSARCVRLPAPEDVASKRTPGITEEDLKLSLAHSNLEAELIKKCRSGQPTSLDNVSLSSASTFNYEFEDPRGSRAQSRSSSREDLRERDLSLGLEEAIKKIDSQKVSTLEEIRRRQNVVPEPPNAVSGVEKSPGKQNSLASFLTGITLVDRMGSPREGELDQDEIKDQSKALEPPTPKPRAEKMTTRPVHMPEELPSRRKEADRQVLVQDQGSKQKRKKRGFGLGRFFSPNLFKKSAKQGEESKAGNQAITRPSAVQSSDGKGGSREAVGPVGEDGTQPSKPVRPPRPPQPSELSKSPAHPSRSRSQPPRSPPQPSKPVHPSQTESDERASRSRLSGPRKGMQGKKGSDSPLGSRQSDLNVGQRRRVFSDSLQSMGSDDVFYDSSDHVAGQVSPGISRDDRALRKLQPGESILPMGGGQSPASEDLPLQRGSASERVKTTRKDQLHGVGGDKSETGKRVYEEFIKEKGLDMVLQKKLINTYNSDDELVEKSAFDRIRNKIKRHRKEARREKERQKGVPSRVITRKDIAEFAGKKEASNLQREESPEFSPLADEREAIISKPGKLSGVTRPSSPKEELAAEGVEDRESTKKSIESYRSLEMRKLEERQKEKEEEEGGRVVTEESERSESPQVECRGKYEKIQNPLEVLTYRDEMKQLKQARDDYFRNKFLKDLAEEAQRNESDQLSSQIEQKEALLRELEAISRELDEKKSKLAPEASGSRSRDQGVGGEQEEADASRTEASVSGTRDATVGTPEEAREFSYPEGSLRLDEDAVIMGAERKETNQGGIVVLDPESADYQTYFDASDDRDEEGLSPIKEYYNEEEGLMPVQNSDRLAETEGLAPVGGFPNLKELLAFEDQDRSLLPPPEESEIPFEEIYLTRHPELLNTDAVGTVNRKHAIKKAFGDKTAGQSGVWKKREFEDFHLTDEAIERLKR